MVTLTGGKSFIEGSFVELATDPIYLFQSWSVAESDIVRGQSDDGPVSLEESLDGMELSKSERLGSEP